MKTWTLDFKLVIATICLALVLGFQLGSIVGAQERPIEGPQVAFEYQGKDANGFMSVVPQEAVTYLGIMPLGESHPAPLEPGRLLICRSYRLNNAYALRCGFDHYGVVTLTIEPKKKDKGDK